MCIYIYMSVCVCVCVCSYIISINTLSHIFKSKRKEKKRK